MIDHTMLKTAVKHRWKFGLANGFVYYLCIVSFAVLRSDAKWNNNELRQPLYYTFTESTSPTAICGVAKVLRGGSNILMDLDVTDERDQSDEEDEEGSADAYIMLAKAIQSRFRANDDDESEPDVETLVKSFLRYVHFQASKTK